MSEEHNVNDSENQGSTNGELQEVVNLGGMYENWFLDYASYVILSGQYRILQMALNQYNAGLCML